MSINALEKALWQLYQCPADTESFRSDAKAYVQDFKLSEAEREKLASLDVMAMISDGANPLLVMMVYQTVNGPHRLPDYFAIVNQAAGDSAAV